MCAPVPTCRSKRKQLPARVFRCSARRRKAIGRQRPQECPGAQLGELGSREHSGRRTSTPRLPPIIADAPGAFLIQARTSGRGDTSTRQFRLSESLVRLENARI